MQSPQANGAVAATWILGAGLIGLLGNVTSIGAAAVVLVCGLVPPTLLMLWWNNRLEPVPVRVRPANL